MFILNEIQLTKTRVYRDHRFHRLLSSEETFLHREELPVTDRPYTLRPCTTGSGAMVVGQKSGAEKRFDPLSKSQPLCMPRPPKPDPWNHEHDRVSDFVPIASLFEWQWKWSILPPF